MSESSTNALALASRTDLIDDVGHVDLALLEELVKRGYQRTATIGVVTGAVAIAATAALTSAALPWAGFAMIPAYVIGFVVAAAKLRKQAALELGLTTRVYDEIERADGEAQRRRLQMSVTELSREDFIGPSPASRARAIKKILDERALAK